MLEKEEDVKKDIGLYGIERNSGKDSVLKLNQNCAGCNGNVV